MKFIRFCSRQIKLIRDEFEHQSYFYSDSSDMTQDGALDCRHFYYCFMYATNGSSTKLISQNSLEDLAATNISQLRKRIFYTVKVFLCSLEIEIDTLLIDNIYQ